MPLHLIALFMGYLLDLALGDPHSPYHPICLIGNLIRWMEKTLRRYLPKTEKGEVTAGGVLVFFVLVISGGIAAILLMVSQMISEWLCLAVSAVICYMMLATKSLKAESMKVYTALKQGNLEEARKAVSMIVGRDTDMLTEEGVAKAAVETVAENTSDGSIAPMFYMALFGPIGGVLYKAVNTMDSMVGYKNDRYLHFGKAAAKLDDLVNWIPSRLAALLMLAVCPLLKLPVKEAWRIFKRDRLASTSPNSGQTESVCAGAFGVQLLGDTWYFGVLHHKPRMGDGKRPVVYTDIRLINQILYLTSYLGLVLFILMDWGFMLLVH